MSLETDLETVLAPLVGGRFTPDVLPEKYVLPAITWQSVGGDAGWYIDNTMPEYLHARIQINVHSTTRNEANAIARQVEKAMASSPFVAVQPLSAFVGDSIPKLKLYTTHQHFGVRYRGTD
jgi:hypothetical protein